MRHLILILLRRLPALRLRFPLPWSSPLEPYSCLPLSLKPFALLLPLSLLLFPPFLAAQSTNADLYDGNQPSLVPLWHRLADYSDRLRSVEACALSPDGRLAVSGSKFGYNVMLWRVADGTLIWEGRHDSEVECVTFSPDGRRVASGGEDYFIRVWDVATGAQLYAYEAERAGFDGISWSPDGRYIVGGDEAGVAVFLDATTYREVARIDCGSTINSLQFTADGRRLVVGGNIQTPDPDGPGGKRYEGFVKVIDVAERTIVQDFGVLPGSVKSVRYAPDERTIAAGGFDSSVHLLDVATGTTRSRIMTAEKVEAVAFTPDGQYLATGGHGLGIDFYHPETGKLAYALPAARTEYLDFSRDGRLLLTGHEDSGLLSCYLLLSNVQARGNYQQVADEQLDNRDLRKGKQ